jgi:DNA-binding transcriptional MocR family regulator
MNRMPAKPQALLDPVDRGLADPQTPFETVAAELFCAMLDGAYPPGTSLPSVKELALAHGVAVSTAQRAMMVLKDKGVITGTSGTRAVALPIDETDSAVTALREHRGGSLARLDASQASPTGDQGQQAADATMESSETGRPAALDLELLRMDVPVRQLWTEADPGNFVQLRKLMESAVKRIDGDLSRIDEYELAIRRAGEPQVIRTLVVAA